MKKEPPKKFNFFIIPFKIVAAIMSGMIILFTIYIYTNYVAVTPLLHLSDVHQSGIDSNNFSKPVQVPESSHEKPSGLP